VIRKGEPWGRPTTGPPDLEVRGSDADLAAAVGGRRGARIRFVPDATSDVARAVGLAAPRGDAAVDVAAGNAETVTELPVDALLVDSSPVDKPDGEVDQLALNMVVVGIAPDRLRWWHRRRPCAVEIDGRAVFEGRATTVVVANGQFLRGLDLVPRGHPGDGRSEVQAYAMGPAARRPMRRRLPTGDHVPHPDIRQHTGRTASIRFSAPRPVEIDGAASGARAEVVVRIAPEALVLLV
jgi:hypothetical protein